MQIDLLAHASAIQNLSLLQDEGCQKILNKHIEMIIISFKQWIYSCEPIKTILCNDFDEICLQCK